MKKKIKKAVKSKTKKKLVKRIKVKQIKQKPVEDIEIRKSKVQDVDYWINRPLNDKERDWHYGEVDWIIDYVASAEHPHRQLIIDALKPFEPIGGILEVGCNAGPNLIRLQSAFLETQLAGIDVVSEAIERAKVNLPNPILKIGNVLNIPFEDKSFDCVLADACLMYVRPKEIGKALEEINRVAKRLVVLVERVSEKEENNGYIWSRNYPKLLKSLGFEVQTRKLTEEDWPESKGWLKSGYLILAKRELQ